MVIQLNGHDLPGASCNPAAPEHPEPYENVHVGIGSRGAAVELVRGDAPAATWRIEVRVVRERDGSIDFRGPLVDGRRGDRFLYLNWGTVDEQAGFRLFRRAKVMLSTLDPSVVMEAVSSDGELHCSFGLTDSRGNPSCARMQPSQVVWTVERKAILPRTGG